MEKIILSLFVSYLLGSIPCAYFLGKIFKGIDIRKHGSGNVGATNAFRVLGPLFGTVALIFDVAKGLVCPTLIADYLAMADNFSWGLSLRIILGLTAVIGHNWTIFLKFRGGKGVATSLGVVIGLATMSYSLAIVLLFLILTWLAVFLATGFVSLSSIFSALLVPVFMIIFNVPNELLILGLFLSFFIIFRHKPNIYRLLHKEEHRFYPLKSLCKLFSPKK